MFSNAFIRLFLFVITFVYVTFGLQHSGSTSSDINLTDLITSKIQTDNCSIPLDRLAFSACDRRYMNLDTVQFLFFRDEVYLCMGVYNVVTHMCNLEKNNVNLTNNIQEVIKEMDIENKSEIYGAKNICNNMKRIKFEAASLDLEPWLRKLNSTLQDNCENTCTKNDEVNPLCIFVLWGNTLLAEPKLEKDTVADTNINTSKLLKKADGKAVNSQISEKSSTLPKTHPSPTVEHTDFSINELDGNPDEPEEVTSKGQENLPLVDGQNYDFPLPEEQDNRLSDEPKISTSASTVTKQSLKISASNEAAEHLETDTDVTNFVDHLKGDMSSVVLPESSTTAWKITSLTKNDVAEQTDSGLPPVYRNHFDNAEDSHFFAYFIAVVTIAIIAYLIYHNKHKFLALILEGRKRREMRRRTTHGGYRKLDSSLEEAVTSTCSTSVTHVIY